MIWFGSPWVLGARPPHLRVVRVAGGRGAEDHQPRPALLPALAGDHGEALLLQRRAPLRVRGPEDGDNGDQWPGASGGWGSVSSVTWTWEWRRPRAADCATSWPPAGPAPPPPPPPDPWQQSSLSVWCIWNKCYNVTKSVAFFSPTASHNTHIYIHVCISKPSAWLGCLPDWVNGGSLQPRLQIIDRIDMHVTLESISFKATTLWKLTIYVTVLTVCCG